MKTKKKAAITTKPQQERTRQKQLERFLILLSSLYPKDQLAPGIIISFLPEGRRGPVHDSKGTEWYGAIYQYPNISGAPTEKRVCIHHAYAPSFNELVDELIEPWNKSLSLLK